MKNRTTPIFALSLVLLAWGHAIQANEFHVATSGSDSNPGTHGAPLKTIQRAAELAQPGDTVTVHAGVYREYVNPPRGGESDARRIVYQAAPGERAEIKGSETVKNWVRVQEDVWKATLPNSFFGGFNPYKDLIHGDWFNPRGREHHTGAVYLNGEWLTEAAKLDEVLAPGGALPSWFHQGGQQFLLNVAWLKPGGGSESLRMPAAEYKDKHGTTNAPCSEGGECVGWIASGDWIRYDKIDFKQGADLLEIRAASAAEGGIIEIRLDSPSGELLGSCTVENTGGWQSWISYKTRIKSVAGLKTICLVFKGRTPDALNPQLWYAKVDEANTTLWAQFKGFNPNEQLVEVNTRRAVFYPDKPGRNFITVRGFVMSQAATPWAPPTAEQVGLIGTHWSKGWIIESNTVSHSVCSGIALGKHGDQYDNTSADTAEGYVKTIERATARGWNKDTIGHHIVRNNTVSHCEQAGIVGSLGAAFSTVTGNEIHDVHVRRLFTGAEMAGIKFHAAIDTVIANNHIHRTCLGLWLDWMAQGTRVSGNLFHDNAGQDLFVEVNHGPFVVDNNLFLSKTSLLDVSEGGAYAHNLFAGKIITSPEPNRETPYHPAHSTTVAGLAKIKGGDDRFYNNIFLGTGKDKDLRDKSKDPGWTGVSGLWSYNFREFPLQTAGNVYYNGALPWIGETNFTDQSGANPAMELENRGGRFFFKFDFGQGLNQASTKFVNTALLGKAKIPGLPYENADGSPLTLGTDYFGQKRSEAKPMPGPFENPGASPVAVWPRK